MHLNQQQQYSCAFTYLDAVLIEKSWQREAFLLFKGFTEDDQLLKEEDSPLLHPPKMPAIWVGHHERVLQQKAALGHDLPLERRSRETSFVARDTARVFWKMYLHFADELTSNPCSRPTFIMSLHLFGTMHMTSTAFYKSYRRPGE